MFFVEPGDSLHIVVEEGTYTFSGPNADNNRFFVELLPRLRGTHLDYEALKVEDFSRQADQWLQDQLGFLAKEREKYALSSVFIDYATTYFNYGWARLMISYPTEYHRANSHDNSEISPEYYDFLDKIPLVNEKAIGVGNYRVFLGRTLDLGLDKVADKRHQTGWLFPKRYDLAKKKLEGRVLYWFLAGELTRGFKRGGEEFASVQRKWEDFQQINPHPEYTEAVQRKRRLPCRSSSSTCRWTRMRSLGERRLINTRSKASMSCGRLWLGCGQVLPSELLAFVLLGGLARIDRRAS